MKYGKKRKFFKKRSKNSRSSRKSPYDEVEEKQNNAHRLSGLKPWEKKYLRLLQWSYVHQGHRPKAKGCLNLLEPLKCEETLVRIDQDDVKAVLKIMGHNWLTNQKRGNQKKKTEKKNWSTKELDELVGSVSREEDELIGWWKRPYCVENIRHNINQYSESTMNPLFFKSYDVEERLWGFAERLKAAAMRPPSRTVEDGLTAGSKKSKNKNMKTKPEHSISSKRKTVSQH